MTEKQLHVMKMDIPLDIKEAVYQNSQFVLANYHVILSPASKTDACDQLKMNSDKHIGIERGQSKKPAPSGSSMWTSLFDNNKLRSAALDANSTV